MKSSFLLKVITFFVPTFEPAAKTRVVIVLGLELAADVAAG
jgi:hypothetical protein